MNKMGIPATELDPSYPSQELSKKPERIPLKVYARFLKYFGGAEFRLRRKVRLAFDQFQVISVEIGAIEKMGIPAPALDPSYLSNCSGYCKFNNNFKKNKQGKF